jgi:large subunit ribosomal protein L9
MNCVKVILLQRISGLGNIGDIVSVKPGFARNYLFNKRFALRANDDNVKVFEEKRAQIEADNEKTKAEAQKIADRVKCFSVTLVRQASEKGQLYGSVTAKDIAMCIKDVTVKASQINLNTPIKHSGIYDLAVDIHPEVSVPLKLSIAKSEEENQLLMTNTDSEIKDDSAFSDN